MLILNGSELIISIHAPRVGSDEDFIFYPACHVLFQSTLPVWGATHPRAPGNHHRPHFNPRSPCGERPAENTFPDPEPLNFNPRSPCGERRFFRRAEGGLTYFNPRSPCGERLKRWQRQQRPEQFQSTLPVWGATSKSITLPTGDGLFQSTLPVWGATGRVFFVNNALAISIHAPRVGSDPRPVSPRSPSENFNPRSPCGERLSIRCSSRWGVVISIHAPRVGSDIQ